MTLKHCNLAVTDVKVAMAFLERYLGMESMGGNAGMGFMTDGEGFVLSLMKAGKGNEAEYPGNFHIGFVVESEAKVDEIHAQLKAGGYETTEPDRHHGYTFYVQAPGGFTVEVMN